MLTEPPHPRPNTQQSRGLKLNPITTLYYVAPCCFGFLLVPWLFLEAGAISRDPDVIISPFLLLTNAMVAFGEQGAPRQPGGWPGSNAMVAFGEQEGAAAAGDVSSAWAPGDGRLRQDWHPALPLCALLQPG